MAKNKNDKASGEAKPHTGLPVHGWAGLFILFVCVSIGYSNYVVYFGTTGLVPKIMLVPSSLFVAAFLGYKAIK